MYIEFAALAEYITKFMFLRMRIENITCYNSKEKIDILKKKFVEVIKESSENKESSILR